MSPARPPLARMLRATSKLGAELDSLSDFVSFGVAPALLVYFWIMQAVPPESAAYPFRGVFWALALFYAMCSAFRLARFNIMIEDDHAALRGTFLVDPDGFIKVLEVHDNGIGRDASELLRKVKAAQYVAAHPGEVCPAKWTEGAATLTPSLDLVGKI